MTYAQQVQTITATATHAKATNGLTLPLSKSLGSQDLAKHRAVVAFELEVLAKKVDRFGWERDRGTPAHDRLLLDWMNALHDYPLIEVQAACRASVLANPNKMPNEGHVVAQIEKARSSFLALQPKPVLAASFPRVVNAAQKARADELVKGFAIRGRV